MQQDGTTQQSTIEEKTQRTDIKRMAVGTRVIGGDWMHGMRGVIVEEHQDTLTLGQGRVYAGVRVRFNDSSIRNMTPRQKQIWYEELHLEGNECNAFTNDLSEELVPSEVFVIPHILNKNPDGDDSCPEEDYCAGHTIGCVKDGHSIGFFYSSAEEVETWLTEHGYQQVSRSGRYPIDGRYTSVQAKPEGVRVTESPRPLTPGESILPFDTIQISLGASWEYGLYSDMANRSFYVCDRQVVVAVFPWDQMREATQEYGRRQNAEATKRDSRPERKGILA